MKLEIIFSTIIIHFFFYNIGNFIFEKNILKRSYNDYYHILISSLIGLYIFAITLILINFFFPIYSKFNFYLIIISTIFFLLNLNLKKQKKILIIIFITSILVSFFSLYFQFGRDAGLYHIPQQNIISNNKVIIGLSQIHSRFGFNSIIEYVSAFFGHDKLFFLNIINKFFLYTLILFIFYLKNNEDLNSIVISIILLIVLILYQRYIYWHATDLDIPVFIIFTITSYFIINFFNKNTNINIIFFLIVLLLSLKSSSAAILIFLLLIFKNFNKQFFVDKLIKDRFVLILIFCLLIFYINNFLISGCIIYPAEFLCFDTSWSVKDIATNEKKLIFSHIVGESFWSYINFKNWIYNHKNFLIISLLIFIIIFACKSLLKFKDKFKIRNIYLYQINLYIITLLIFWLWNAPTIRFGLGALVSLFITYVYTYSINSNLKYKKKYYEVLFFMLISFFILFNYLNVVKYESTNSFNKKKLKVELKKNNNFGFNPANGTDQCWFENWCYPLRPQLTNKWNNIYLQKYYGYYLFKKNKS